MNKKHGCLEKSNLFPSLALNFRVEQAKKIGNRPV